MDVLAEGDYVQLAVSDTGRGMPPETQARAFDPFFSTKATGRGLGLAVVSGIVRRLGGAIHLTSEPGHGTTVQILLPCAENGLATANGRMPQSAELARATQVTSVLIVEDEDMLRQAASRMLHRNGFSVIEARSGSDALDVIRVQQRSIDVLLLDITLPGAPSWQVLREAMHLRPQMKVIVTSAYNEELASASLQCPVQYFLRKPYKFNDLTGLIRHSLGCQ
jgi:CheY-like chemotaxis protein